jgi:hypothetical protein
MKSEWPTPTTAQEARKLIRDIVTGAVLAVPGRIVGELAKGTDPERCRALMREALVDALAEVSDELRALAREAPAPAREVLEVFAAGLDPRQPS